MKTYLYLFLILCHHVLMVHCTLSMTRMRVTENDFLEKKSKFSKFQFYFFIETSQIENYCGKKEQTFLKRPGEAENSICVRKS